MNGSKTGAGLFELANRIFAQSAARGALPTLYAATAADVQQGAYYGPQGFMHLWGRPGLDRPAQKLMSGQVAEDLWKLSESLTGTAFKP